MISLQRPVRVTSLVIIILWFVLWNGLRLVQAIVFWNVLVEYHAEPGPLYSAMMGGLWFLVGLILIWGLWFGNTWSWSASFGASALYIAWYWFDRLVLQLPNANWPFTMGTSIISLLSFLLILFFPRIRQYITKRTQ